MKRTPKSPLRGVLATRMRRRRAQLGWSQERLAFEAGLNRTYLSAVERSEQNMSIDNVARVAAALGLGAWQLLLPLEWEGPMAEPGWTPEGPPRRDA